MNKLKTIFLSEAGYFIHLALFITFFLLTKKEVIYLPFLIGQGLYLFRQHKYLLIFGLVLTSFIQASIFLDQLNQIEPSNTEIKGVVEEVKTNHYQIKYQNHKIYVFLEEMNTLQPGDEVLLEGRFFSIDGYEIEHTYQYQIDLNHHQISGLFYANEVAVLSSGFHINLIPYNIKQWVLKTFDKETTPYLFLFVFGDDDYLISSSKDKINQLGITHLFAISGMHIGMIALFIQKLLRRLPLLSSTKNIILTLILVFYLLLTGFQISQFRATLLVLGLLYFPKKKYFMTQTDLLSFIFCGCLLYQPKLFYTLGFQFSFLISFALLLNRTNRIANELTLIFKTSIFCTLISLPILLSINKQIGFMQVFANVFFILFVRYLFLPGTFLILLYPVVSNGYLFMINTFQYALNLFSQWNWQIHFNFPKPIYRIAYAFFVFLGIRATLYRKSTLKPILGVLFVVILSLLQVDKMIFPSVRFFDVNQADAILIQSGTCQMMIDTGSQDDYHHIASYLSGENIYALDYLVLTHNHEDHIGEALHLLQKIKVNKVFGNQLDINSAYSIDPLYEGDSFNCGNIRFEVLNSFHNSSNENNNSIVLYAQIGTLHFLFMGDAEKAVEEKIIEKYQLDVDVLKVGHHGSKTSSTTDFITKLKPRYAVISVSENNAYGFPNETVLNLYRLVGTKILRTDQDHTIVFYPSRVQEKIQLCSGSFYWYERKKDILT